MIKKKQYSKIIIVILQNETTMRKINIYYVFDGLLSIAIVFFLLSRKDIRFLYGAGALVIITVILVVLESIEKTQLTQTIVENESDSAVFFKPEDGSGPLVIAPNTSAQGVDGIKVSDKVFKACSGTHVVVEDMGRIKTKSISGKVANMVRGGIISKAPDKSWEPLFNA